jgi:hypothetical protein
MSRQVATFAASMVHRGYVDAAASVARLYPLTIGPCVQAAVLGMTEGAAPISNRASYHMALAGLRGGKTVIADCQDILSLQLGTRSLMWERWLAGELIPTAEFGWRPMLVAAVRRASGDVLPTELCAKIIGYTLET